MLPIISTGILNFGNTPNLAKSQPNLTFLYDAASVWSNGQQIQSGSWRAATPQDFAANVSLSGASLTIGAIAVTGTTYTQIVNPVLAISGVVSVGSINLPDSQQVTGGYIGITGIVKSSLPTASNVEITSVTTAAMGLNYTNFPSIACNALDLVNHTFYDIEYKRNGNIISMPILANTARYIVGLSNANEISLRRMDSGSNQITLYAEAITL